MKLFKSNNIRVSLVTLIPICFFIGIFFLAKDKKLQSCKCIEYRYEERPYYMRTGTRYFQHDQLYDSTCIKYKIIKH